MELKKEALRLPEQERMALAEELWASIEEPNDLRPRELPQWQKDLLDRRLEEDEGEGISWAALKAELLSES